MAVSLTDAPELDARFRQRALDIQGEEGHRFRIVLRQNSINMLDFSIILMFIDEDGTSYRLCRFNGRHPSLHTNKWEKQRGLPGATFHNRFHIHHATERYQVAELEIDGYAEPTQKYSSFDTALEAFIGHNGFQTPDRSSNLPLFEQGADHDDD